MPKDPPIGRIGYVFPGFGEGRGISAPREIRCNGCRHWYDGKLLICPECEHPRSAFNKRLRSAQLDNHLMGYAHHSAQQASLAPVTSNVT